MNPKSLRFYVFSGRGTQPIEHVLYNKCYRTWKTLWQETFFELEGTRDIFSDAFTRQDKICGIFYEDQCIAVAALREYDFSIETTKDDSIFSSWDPTSFALLTKDGPKVMVCSNLAVDSNFRGDALPHFSLKSLAIYLCTQLMLDSDCHSMAGTTRSNRGVNKAAFNNGAHFIKRSEMHGVAVDLVAFYKSELAISTFYQERSLSRSIWDQRTDFTGERPIIQLKVA